MSKFLDSLTSFFYLPPSQDEIDDLAEFFGEDETDILPRQSECVFD